MLVVGAIARASVPSQFTVQGVLRDNTGKLQSTSVNVTVKLFDAQTAGNQLGPTFGPTAVGAENGLFTLTINAPSLAGDIKSTQPWMEVSVGNDTFARQLVTPVVYAVLAAHADNATSADSLSGACSGCVADSNIGSLSGSKLTANSVPQTALASRAGYKSVSNSGHVDLPTSSSSATVLTLTFTPTAGTGVAQVSASGQGVFWYHTNSTSAVPDRWNCCVASGSVAACSDFDIPSTWPTEGGGSGGTYVSFNLSYPFVYAGSGAFTATLSCSVPASFTPPPNGSSYGYVAGSQMTAVFIPADPL
jgi:hypothetical protein